MGKIISIANNKGGVGKTIVSINLASAIAMKKKRVLVIDADPQSNTTMALLPRTIHLKNTMYEILDPDITDFEYDINTFIYPTIRNSVNLLPNIIDSAGHEISLIKKISEGRNPYLILRSRLRKFCLENFDYVLIDNMPSLGIFLSLTFNMSDLVIIPVDVGSASSMVGVERILDLMEGIQATSNPDLNSARIIMNRVDKRVSACLANIENTKHKFGAENIFVATIPSSADFQTAEALPPNTIFSHNSKSKGAHAFRKIAEEFLDKGL